MATIIWLNLLAHQQYYPKTFGINMHRQQTIRKIIALTAICLSMLGCSKSDRPEQEITIAPGQFALDEPSKLAQDKISLSSQCSADTVNGRVRSKELTWQIKHGEEVVLHGWTFSPSVGETGPEVFVRLTGAAKTYYAVTTSRHMRPDVNQHHHLDPSITTGFDLKATTEQIEPGIYDLMIIQLGSNGAEGCDPAATIIVN